MQRNAARLEMFSIDIADRHLRRRRRCHLSCHLFRRHIRRHPCRPHHHHHEYAMHALPLLRCSPFAIAAATTRLIDSNWSCLRDRHLLLLLLQDGRDDDGDNHDDDHCSLRTLIMNVVNWSNEVPVTVFQLYLWVQVIQTVGRKLYDIYHNQI